VTLLSWPSACDYLVRRSFGAGLTVIRNAISSS
jgi:hypothetical protein